MLLQGRAEDTGDEFMGPRKRWTENVWEPLLYTINSVYDFFTLFSLCFVLLPSPVLGMFSFNVLKVSGVQLKSLANPIIPGMASYTFNLGFAPGL
jgi:hypothetical protein